MKQNKVFSFMFIALLAAPLAAQESRYATSLPDLEARLARLERVLNSEVLVELHQRILDLDEESVRLRDRMDHINHQLDELVQRQRVLYLDADRRMQIIEKALRSESVGPQAATETETGDTASAVSVQQATAIYQDAYERLQEKRYTAAIAAFTDFMSRFPTHEYAGNAQYWLGEAYYVQESYEQALAAFGRVVERFPNSGKVPDARLKIGFAQAGLGQWEAARKTLETVRQNFPDSTVSRLAQERLKQLGQQGH